MLKILALTTLLSCFSFAETIRVTEKNITEFYVKKESRLGIQDYDPIYFNGKKYSFDDSKLADTYSFKQLITIIKKRNYKLVKAEEFETFEVVRKERDEKKDVIKNEKMDGPQ